MILWLEKRALCMVLPVVGVLSDMFLFEDGGPNFGSQGLSGGSLFKVHRPGGGVSLMIPLSLGLA